MTDAETRVRLGADYRFDVIEGMRLTDSDCMELSRVFSSFYGKWSAHSPFNPGGQIKMSPARYRAWYASEDFRIARCFCADRLVAHAVYVDLATSRGRVAFVVQLVVDAAHRHQGIATSILHAAFGFSDYYAWAIVTSSPCTIASLENSTLRRGDPSRIAIDQEFVRDELFSKIPFLSHVELEVSENTSRVNTAFFTDRSQRQPNAEDIVHRYGDLPEGYEWLAVVFRDQRPSHLSDLVRLIERSLEFVQYAYRRMPQAEQPWAARASDEVDFILRSLPAPLDKHAAISDFGAGCGRHLAAFGDRGFLNVTGIDLAPSALAISRGSQGVIAGDCREWHLAAPCRLITCLYDVIGSFADEEQNRRIVSNIAKNLASDGFAVLSVANRDYAAAESVREIDSSDDADFLEQVFRLKPSNAMSSDGEFFRHPALCDPRRGLYFHKEQFKDGRVGLPAEYLIVDRRYTLEEITALVTSAGLEVISSRYVRAGFDTDYSRSDGKEILLVCRLSAPKGGAA